MTEAEKRICEMNSSAKFFLESFIKNDNSEASIYDYVEAALYDRPLSEIDLCDYNICLDSRIAKEKSININDKLRISSFVSSVSNVSSYESMNDRGYTTTSLTYIVQDMTDNGNIVLVFIQQIKVKNHVMLEKPKSFMDKTNLESVYIPGDWENVLRNYIGCEDNHGQKIMCNANKK